MAERILLNFGTVESIIIDVADRLKNLTTLAGTSPWYDVRVKGTTPLVLANQDVTSVGMTAYCVVDTTALAPNTVYELLLQFNNLPERPRLGPFPFEVNA